MKLILLAFAFLFTSFAVKAEDFRTWTLEATKKTIEAKIIEKDDAASTVTVMMKNLNTVKLDVSKLIEDDQKFVKDWVKPIDPRNQLTVRVVQSGKYGAYTKKLEVDVVAYKDDVKVSGGCCAGCNNIRKTVASGTSETFTVITHDNYSFTLTDLNGLQIDQESATKKTGVTKLK